MKNYNIKSKIIFLAILFFGIFGLVEISRAAWTPPIGIPVPPFPSDLDVVRPAPPIPWTSEVAGNYYIQRDQAGCSDSRAYGAPSAARCSLPSSPPAGSKVFLHGVYSTYPTISWTGTANSPIWLIAYDNSNKPNMSNGYAVNSIYTILDGISSSMTVSGGIGVAGRYTMLRNFTFTNSADGSNYSGVAVGGGGNNIVIYKATVGPLGNWQYAGAGDIDTHGGNVSGNANYIWFLDSTWFHAHGDGIQIENGSGNAAGAHHIYIGRNLAYENYQSGFWTKNATDVIMSQNEVWGMHVIPTNASVGEAMGGQYDPKYVWFIANKLHDSSIGLKMSGGNNGGGGPWYAIGNVIYNIYHSTAACNPWGMGALSYRNEGGLYAYFNTIDNVDSFISVIPANSGEFRDNIFTNQYTPAGCPALNDDGYGTYTIDYNLWDNDNIITKYNGTIRTTLSSFASATGQETHRVVGSPLLNVDRSISSNSPAIDTANPTEEAVFATFQSRYGVDIRKDFAGSTRPSGARWDIGAYEYVSGAPVDTTPPAAPSGLVVN
ncbi:MAG: hypothetical protein NUV83_03005 [Candidatus Wolfebacteria bacterium]|nr:hypothetical protein [Candidatus Wolfebacteria bacterium]